MFKSIATSVLLCLSMTAVGAWDPDHTPRVTPPAARQSHYELQYQARQAEEKEFLESVTKLREQPEEKLVGKALEEVDRLVSDLSDPKFKVREAATLALFKLSKAQKEVLKEIRQRGRAKKVSLEAQVRIKAIFRNSATVLSNEQMTLLLSHRIANSAEAKALRDEENQMRQSMSPEDVTTEPLLIEAINKPQSAPFNFADDEREPGMRGHMARQTQMRLPRTLNMAGFYGRVLAKGNISELKQWESDSEAVYLSYVRGKNLVRWRVRGDGSYQIFMRPVSGGSSTVEISATEVAPPLSLSEHLTDVADLEPVFLELALQKDPQSGEEIFLASRPRVGQEFRPLRQEVMCHLEEN